MLTIEGLWIGRLWLFLTRFVSLFPKEFIPQVTLELDRFLKLIGMWRLTLLSLTTRLTQMAMSTKMLVGA
jgi:hypothetical protein